MSYKPFFWALVFSLLIICQGCGDDTDYVLENMQEIEQYLADNNFTAEQTNSGLYYIIEQEGEGDPPGPFTEVEVIYRGYFTDGSEFDSSRGSSIRFPLNNVIVGWQEGIPFFKKGGSGKLFVPSHLGYGSSGRGSIPGNTVIIFDVEVLDY